MAELLEAGGELIFEDILLCVPDDLVKPTLIEAKRYAAQSHGVDVKAGHDSISVLVRMALLIEPCHSS